ncbi:tumor necrosis factor ligand superfamily member 10-like [Seriola lalandi dorsalis]|uniref:tumor necrosis factor ligand superfamily member 10-like n=1 Tax=Seriola lalandi dorsalis TaxID=1841481 RepID=UPI000C6F89E5|nr:tumor necrosis factor ligand superfamily member 10-like [Seriola lalandi dorsalis]
MTGSGPKLGVLLLLAVLLQTVVVTITVLHFTTALNSVRKQPEVRTDEPGTRGGFYASLCPQGSCGECYVCFFCVCFIHFRIRTLQELISDFPLSTLTFCFFWRHEAQKCINAIFNKWSLLFSLQSLSQRYQRQISSAVRDEVSRVLPSLVMEDRASPRPKVAAHVTGSFVPKLEREGGAPVSTGRRVQGQKISWWEGQKGLAFLQDVQLVDGELVVPQPGLYYVYAQTYFRHTHSLEEEGEDEEEAEDRGRPLLQYVYKKVSSYPVPILLMKTSRTSCWSRGSQFSLHSAHQGGLFPLSAGDRLFVTVTNASAVDMDEKSSFFGAFLIS